MAKSRGEKVEPALEGRANIHKRAARTDADADAWLAKKFRWDVTKVDRTGPYSFDGLSVSDFIKVIERLKGLESMTWNEVSKQPHCHPMPVAAIERAAKIRASQHGIDDLYQLGCGSKPRIFGVRDVDIFYVLWWDPEHRVYPTEKSS